MSVQRLTGLDDHLLSTTERQMYVSSKKMLHSASLRSGDAEILDVIEGYFAREKVILDFPHSNGETLLMTACRHAHLDISASGLHDPSTVAAVAATVAATVADCAVDAQEQRVQR